MNRNEPAHTLRVAKQIVAADFWPAAVLRGQVWLRGGCMVWEIHPFSPAARGHGTGKALTNACLALAKQRGHAQVVLHTTQSMKTAWRLYRKLGFTPSPDLDFQQEGLPVFGFRLKL